MKTRIIIYLIILLGGLGAFVFYTNWSWLEKYLDTQSYCGHFSINNCPQDFCKLVPAYKQKGIHDAYQIVPNICVPR